MAKRGARSGHEPSTPANGRAGAGGSGAMDEIVAQWRRERPDLDASPIALFGRVHRVYLRYQAVIAKGFAAYGLNASSFDVLAALRRTGAPHRKSSTELANESLLSSAGVTFRLDRLEEAGLIERQRDTEDRRVVYSQLTAKGLDVIDRAMASHLANEHRLLAGLSEAERTQLARLLAKLEDSIVTAQRDRG
jgi:DNA-binding MarR family transcriptional regulator